MFFHTYTKYMSIQHNWLYLWLWPQCGFLVLVQSPKLTSVEPGQYLKGVTTWVRCCKLRCISVESLFLKIYIYQFGYLRVLKKMHLLAGFTRAYFLYKDSQIHRLVAINLHCLKKKNKSNCVYWNTYIQ